MNASEDGLLLTLADYVCSDMSGQGSALRTARLCLLDALGCLAVALKEPDIQHLLGPLVPGTFVPRGARVPGTDFELDPVRAAFSTSTLIRWLDFSDTTFRGGHPSDNIGAIIACADFVSRREHERPVKPCLMRHVLDGMIRAYEIQGRIAAACKVDKPEVGLDAVLAVRVASAGVCARLLGGDRQQVLSALSNAWLDGGTLNAYRHPPNAGPRKGWAGADAASRGVLLAMMAISGEPGYPAPLSARPWGFYEVFLDSGAIEFQGVLGWTVLDNIIFKLIPCQRNGTTAVEAALMLHASVAPRIDEVRRIVVYTHAEAIERIDKKGPLPNPEARDHCLQFMVSAALTFGHLSSAHYREPLALDPRVERLRASTEVVEDQRYTRDYLDPAMLSCANAVQVEFTDGSSTPRVEIHYPAGDPSRRHEALPHVRQKFITLAEGVWSLEKRAEVLALLLDGDHVDDMPVRDFLTLLTGE